MGQCHAARLSDRGVIRVAGADARKFLQGLITSDLDKMRDGAVHAGLLSPQGKVLFDFFVVPEGDAFLLDVAQEASAEIHKRLGFYRLRADVEISDATSLEVAAVWGEGPELPDGVLAYADPRLAELGFRLLLPSGTELGALGCAQASEEDFHAMRIRLGVPEGGRDYRFGDVFPHEALFDQLNGVDFAKGCFVGQEVVSRMEHRGTARKRVVPVEAKTALPPSGTSVEAGGVPIGTLGSVSGTSGLALVRLDRAEQAATRGTPLTAGEIRITLRRPGFARFAVPGTVPA